MTAPALDPSLLTALEAFAARSPVLVALDFDGVLAPIVAQPGDARPLPASAAAVAGLAAADGVTVALVSGRSLESLRAVADPPPSAVLVASHGAEVAGAVLELSAEQEALLAQVVEGLGAVVAAHEGTALERKPAGAVLHTRRASPDVAAEATAAALTGPATLPGVRAMRGKEVVELSVVDADKGSAVAALRSRLGVDAALFAGDDVTDEDAFAVLDTAAGDVPVKVGPGETAAPYRVPDPEAVAVLLQHLLSRRA
ncbi:trehalose-phosphatase [Quadrisphaera sp. DSM 44207]|uniref:trehalose-phosphatase n=1 Tax=Quadrisphaera sp. DSM 44207 TaxID=1881057 RepID=UPI00088406A4|nr:trehalose-phosphatase [Quadrisphaera sp. DSM 44207]SDQ62415.1 trehalose 6-phosphatase [Quadrisphaera sp. DSM 44207]